MQAHYLQHVSFEGLGSIEVWLKGAGYEIKCTQCHTADKLPDIEDVDLLIVMGGPMSVNDEKQYPWLIEEKKFIKRIIQEGKPTLGVCLGAQLIANSMGSDVFPNSVKEIGWFPVRAVNSESGSAFSFPEKTDVFHWHGETFSLPDQAVLIADGKGCKNQAFQIGDNIIGLQFHLETTSDSVRAIVDNCGNELVGGKYIQTEEEILSASGDKYISINNLMVKILDYITR